MTRKGAKQQAWTTAEEQYLRDNAGRMSRREICRQLKRSSRSIETKARRLGVSLRCYSRKLEWCTECATWRSTVSPRTGRCRVCEKREMLAKSEDRVSEAFQLLSIEQRAIYAAEEAGRGRRRQPRKPIKQPSTAGSLYARSKSQELYMRDIERWEIRCLDLQINANKTRLKRIRNKLGINPRKKFK